MFPPRQQITALSGLGIRERPYQEIRIPDNGVRLLLQDLRLAQVPAVLVGEHAYDNDHQES